MSINLDKSLSNIEKYELIRNEILNILSTCNTNQAIISKISTSYIVINSKKYKLKDIIYFYTNFLNQYESSISERFYYIYHDIRSIVKCQYCNTNKPTFQSFESGYRQFCSNDCSVKSRNTGKKKEKKEKTKKEEIISKPKQKEKQESKEPEFTEITTINKLTENNTFKNFTEFLDKYNVEYVINKNNLDVYLPKNNLAIELNTLSHDTELNGKTKYYFINKKNLCNKNNIELINIFEDEWYHTPNIVKSVILNKLQLSPKKIYARKCKIDKVESNKAKMFLNDHHIQGHIHSKYNFGLYHNRHLVSLLTLGVSRYNENYQYELHRFCSYLGHNVVGGFSKLLKFVLDYLNIDSIITYADLRFGNGNVYNKNGFEKLTSSQPNYFYVEKDIMNRSSRVQFQKHKLSKKLDSFNENKTEWENMKANGYDRIWDCGNAVYGIKRGK